ncbi:hypothetical protein B447_13599 [Thauera sp. 27]|nr:hypothetical protein B447_13599 [Thauera sp. 27]
MILRGTLKVAVEVTALRLAASDIQFTTALPSAFWCSAACCAFVSSIDTLAIVASPAIMIDPTANPPITSSSVTPRCWTEYLACLSINLNLS